MSTQGKDLTNQVIEVMGFENYRGLILRKLIGGYEWAGIYFTSKEEIDEHLRKVSETISTSYRNKKKPLNRN